MQDERPLLLTPGPLSISDRVRSAMMRDWGSRDPEFVALTRRVMDGVHKIAGGDARHIAIPLQGSGTFAVEAMLRCIGDTSGELLILANGAYGRRMVEICKVAGLPFCVIEGAEDTPIDPQDLQEMLEKNPSITRVAAVHCETTSGLLNPIEDIANLCRVMGKDLLIDAMSAFGAVPLSIADLGVAAIAASSNKCLQGPPGIGLVICDRDALNAAAPGSLVLDLKKQMVGLEGDGQWLYTPPTHVVAGLAEALDELDEEGGPTARLDRYSENFAVLSDGMTRLGFSAILAPEVQAPVIVSFFEPGQDWYNFEAFYDALKDRGFAIYAGKMRAKRSFRVGVIGDVTPSDLGRFIGVVEEVVARLRET